MAGGEHMII